MLSVFRERHARDDLIEIWRYVATSSNSFAIADRLLDRFESTFAMLATHPEAGRSRSDLAPELRSFPAGGYVIYYRATTRIEVVRILSAYRDLSAQNFPDT